MNKRSGGKVRLDALLVERGLAPTRSKAAAIILAGQVLVNNVPVTKAGTAVCSECALRLRGETNRFVGRGGEKLEAALDFFKLNVEGRVCLDLGASTGGFTDCLLQRGAVRVFAVDVGENQLDYRLRIDNRVVVMEKTHAKHLSKLNLEPTPTLATIDLSFISIRKILDDVLSVLYRPFQIVMLIKPQFELGREYVESGGVVRKEADQLLAVEQVTAFCRARELEIGAHFPSPLRGAKKGNQEYFLLVSKS